MMYKKNAISALLSLLMGVAAVSLMSLSPARWAWSINTWSVEYTRHAFNTTPKQYVGAVPPEGHARAALWLASDALDEGDPTLAESLIASKAEQGNEYAMYLMAHVRLAEGDFAGAVAIWKQAGDYHELIRVASQAQQAGRLEEALMAYEAAWAVDPESGTTSFANFLIYHKKDYGRVENLLRQSLAYFPNSIHHPDWFFRLGEVLRFQKCWDEAVAMYERVIILTPDAWKAHLGLGWAKYHRGDALKMVMSEFQDVINIPESLGAGQFAIAQMLARENRFLEADAWYARAFTLKPNDWSINLTRGNAARRAGNLVLAFEVYRDTLARFPDNPSIYYEMAYAYQLNDQPANAIAAIEQALVLIGPANVDYFIRAGDIYEWAGDEIKALEAYYHILLIDQKNVTALENVDRLEKTRSSPLN